MTDGGHVYTGDREVIDVPTICRIDENRHDGMYHDGGDRWNDPPKVLNHNGNDQTVETDIK